MIIFDWDDTLLATTYLGMLGFVDIPREFLETIRPLDESAVFDTNHQQDKLTLLAIE